MKIDFNEIPFATMPSFKGGDKWADMKIVDDGAMRMINGCLQPGASIGEHCHEDSCEIMFFTSGRGLAIVDGVEETLAPGMCHYCPKGSTHTLRSVGEEPLCFYAVVPKM